VTPAARERKQVRQPVLLVSAWAWTLLVIGPRTMALPDVCAMAMGGGAAEGSGPWAALRGLWSARFLAAFALSWLLMLAAMMGPLVIPAARHVREVSFARRRVRAMALFGAGYAGSWMAAGILLLVMVMTARGIGAGAGILLWATLGAALVWELSPMKQRCLNRGHAHGELAAFGAAADGDAAKFGLVHGMWCVGSCWALMVVPMMAGRGQAAAMGAVALWIWGQRLERPGPLGWRWRWPGTAVRLVMGRIGMGSSSLNPRG
jgi:predicted metal-binding membrane protein